VPEDPGQSFGDVRVTVADHVAAVTICRAPDNFFDQALIASLADAYEALAARHDVRCIVLGAEGKNFCAGAALGRRSTPAPGGGHLYDQALRLFAAPLPVVAAVRGAAVGGGLGLALSADFRVGSSGTRCTANFARLGFHHGFALSVTLPAVVGRQRALELLYTGARLSGQHAHDIGLLDRLVEDDDIDAAAHRLAREIATSAPLAVRSIRQTMRSELVDQVRAATARERAEQDRLSATADFAEGVRAMAERRTPEFHGR
jgi:enoyl-CoA hydratase/carnithine racemase